MAITAGLLAVAAVVGLSLTVFVIGGAGESPSTPPDQGMASGEASLPIGGSPSASPSDVPSATPEPATPSPTVAAPIAQIALADSQANGIPHLEVTWEEVPDAGSYELAYDAGDGEWQPADLESESTTSATIEVVADETYRFRVRAVTADGTSEWAMGEPVRLTTVEEDSPSVRYDGFWDRAIHESYVGDDVRFTTVGGAAVELSFVGSGVAWRGPLGPGRGRSDVFLDGESVGQVDQGDSTFTPRNILYATSFQDAGEHELRIDVEGTAGRPNVAVDAFYVLEAAAE